MKESQGGRMVFAWPTNILVWLESSRVRLPMMFLLSELIMIMIVNLEHYVKSFNLHYIPME